MLRDSVNPFTVLCLCGLLIACANLEERGKAAGRNADPTAVLGQEAKGRQGAAVEGTKTVSAPPRVRERPHSKFDRELEEELEEEEERGARQRQRSY